MFHFILNVHALGLFEIPSQFTPQATDHLFFSHKPDWPKYFGAVKSTSPLHDVALLSPFVFLHVFPLESITHPSGQFDITGGQSPWVFAFNIEYITAAKNPSSKTPAIVSTIR
jgi:hypothetical protein